MTTPPPARRDPALRPSPARAEPPVVPHVGLTVQPGQTLLLAVKSDATVEQAAAIAETVKERLPGVDVVVLAGVEQMAVYDPQAGVDSA